MRLHAVVAAGLVCTLALTAVGSGVRHLYPGQSLGSMMAQLSPGDTLIVHSVGGDGTGRYGRSAVYGMNGDDIDTPEEEWITVMAAPGEPRPVVYHAGTDKNLLEFYYWLVNVRIQGLEFVGGSDAIKFVGGGGWGIVLDDLVMHEVGNTGINLSGCGDVSDMVIRRCEIYNTGSAGHGEGMYLGTHGYQGTGMGILHDSVIEWNTVHHTGGDQGDGIELKYEDYGVIVRDNVVHDTPYPSILSYGSARPGAADNNVIERNVVWNCGDWAITAFQTTTVMNNLVLGGGVGIYVGDRADNTAGTHDGRLRNVYVYNNTVYNPGGYAGYFLVSNRTDIEICNNLFYRPSSGSAAVYINGTSGVVLQNNYFYGRMATTAGFTAGPDPATAFVRPGTVPGEMDFYPRGGTMLIDAGHNGYGPSDDFNGSDRPVGAAVEPGAYERDTEANPGWAIDAGFKGLWADGDLNVDGQVDDSDLSVMLAQFTGPVSSEVVYGFGGQAVLEAEHYVTKTSGDGAASGVTWEDRIGDGSVGDGYVAIPTGVTVTIDGAEIQQTAPRLSYRVFFNMTGAYYLWIKGVSEALDTATVHYGMDGVPLSSDAAGAVVLPASNADFTWVNERGNGNRVWISVSTPGEHTIDLWMREAGVRVDRVELNTQSLYVPNEPAETPHEPPPSMRADLDGDGDVDMADVSALMRDVTGD